MATDQFQAPDYYLMDELLTEEHKLIRDSARAWVKKEISPIIPHIHGLVMYKMFAQIDFFFEHNCS